MSALTSPRFPLAWPGVLSRADVRLSCGLICAEWVMRGQFVERGMFSVFVGGNARSYHGNKMNRWFPDS